jgi:hypothetical protein
MTSMEVSWSTGYSCLDSIPTISFGTFGREGESRSIDFGWFHLLAFGRFTTPGLQSG